MAVQWYPGHMHKAAREIKETLGKVDLAIEILDARIPYSSQNPLLTKLRSGKPCIKVLTKCDLADQSAVREWQDFFEQEDNTKTLAVAKDQTGRIKQLTALCRKLAGAENAPDRLVNVLVMGIPNAGKSTLINILAGRTVAKTGDEPAVTRHQQRIAVDHNVVLWDTPGMLWPNVENRHSGYRLAATGAVKDTALNHEEIADYLLTFLLTSYPENLTARYQLGEPKYNAHELLTLIGKQRGCLRAGGIVERDKAAKLILTEFRSGLLGQICLETPAMLPAELEQVEQQRQVKAAKKLARKAKRSGKPDQEHESH